MTMIGEVTTTKDDSNGHEGHQTERHQPWPKQMLTVACTKNNAKWKRLIFQCFIFMFQYMGLRGECQEVHYNLGRAFHQIGKHSDVLRRIQFTSHWKHWTSSTVWKFYFQNISLRLPQKTFPCCGTGQNYGNWIFHFYNISKIFPFYGRGLV